MTFLARWVASLFVIFLLYPVMFVVWNGPDRDFGYGGGIVMMMFLQFISPYGFWKTPLAVGTLIAIGWQLIALRKAACPSS